MLCARQEEAVSALAGAIFAIRPLVLPLAPPVRVSGPAELGPVLDHVAGRLRTPSLRLISPDDRREPDRFMRVVSDRLGLAGLAPALPRLTRHALPEVDRVVDEVAARDFESFCEVTMVTGHDGVRVPAYAAGKPGAPAVVISSACGMPARLAEGWVRRLSVSYYVLTWESRGLFADFADFGGRTDVAAQAADLVAVMDHFEVASAHVAGLCGGAVIALDAARRWPERVSSLSLWHGDFDLGPGTPKTEHQRNLQALMAIASRTPASATDIHFVLSQSMVDSVPPELAHLVLCPYVTPVRFFRYCQLNGAIMSTDVRGALAGVGKPTLVVTSADDTTAHPDSSRLVAEALPGARLVELSHGDHISLFQQPPDLLLDTVEGFISLGKMPAENR